VVSIVRKTLSEYEIAIIQTTAVDQASRMLNLTTLLGVDSTSSLIHGLQRRGSGGRRSRTTPIP